jgi:hypothetical protein
MKRFRKVLLRTPVEVLTHFMESTLIPALHPGFRRELSDAFDSSLSGVCLSHEDCDEACRPQAAAEAGLHICPRCGSTLVQPTRWEQVARPGHWRLWRRCPECRWTADAIHGEHEIDAFDEALEKGGMVLTAQLNELEREGVREIADVFAAALEADLITADDFRL